MPVGVKMKTAKNKKNFSRLLMPQLRQHKRHRGKPAVFFKNEPDFNGLIVSAQTFTGQAF